MRKIQLLTVSNGRALLSGKPLLLGPQCSIIRWQSSFVPHIQHNIQPPSFRSQLTPKTSGDTLMTRLPTWHLLRNMMLSLFLTQPLLLKPGLAVMKKIADSKSALLNPDRNLLLKACLKPVVYDHFCAGTNATEIKETVKNIKKLGFEGVVLCYNKEVQLNGSNEFLGIQGKPDGEILAWRDENIVTLDAADKNGWIGLKFTGAGKDVTEALVHGRDPPPAFTEAMQAICEKAISKNCRVWVDSEQQAVQPMIDQWTIALMRKYNTEGKVLLYNTVQAYLKEARSKLKYQLDLANQEGWTLAVKLVRGAYIGNDIRSRIHDTKADTDASYNGIVHDMLSGTFDGYTPDTFPHMKLFLAGHNQDTVRMALNLASKLASRGELKANPEFGQLMGMADDVGCEIIQFAEEAQAQKEKRQQNDNLGTSKEDLDKDQQQQSFVPRAYKVLHWGSVQVSMQYLVRRAIENSAAVDRMRQGASASRKELVRRLTPRFMHR